MTLFEKSDQHIIDRVHPAEAQKKPDTEVYASQYYSATEGWLFQSLFSTIDACKNDLQFKVCPRRVVRVSRYYPYPPIAVIWYKHEGN